MRCAIVGLGIQGKKRRAVAGTDAVATVDIDHAEAQYRSITDVPLHSYDAALVCTPDHAKIEILEYLLSNRKHVLVEKPLMAASTDQLVKLNSIAAAQRVSCYTAYNHRFEPHFVTMKRTIESGSLGSIYAVKMFYGNGTARDVRNSPWRDTAAGILPDIGSHLLDATLFLFGAQDYKFEPLVFKRCENKSFDYVNFASQVPFPVELSATLLSWRNSFRMDVFGEKGTAHINCLCKWGPSTYTQFGRVLPSGKPDEHSVTIACADPTWKTEYDHFKSLCKTGISNIENDIWLNEVINGMARKVL